MRFNPLHVVSGQCDVWLNMLRDHRQGYSLRGTSWRVDSSVVPGVGARVAVRRIRCVNTVCFEFATGDLGRDAVWCRLGEAGVR